jgi:hypothetical protein
MLPLVSTACVPSRWQGKPSPCTRRWHCCGFPVYNGHTHEGIRLRWWWPRARGRGRGRLPGAADGVTRKGSTMGDGYGATGTRQQRLILVGLLGALLMTSAAPGHAPRGVPGGHGGHGVPPGSHDGHGAPHRGHGFIGPRVVVPIWPYWNPYWDLYVPPPPSVVTPPPQVYIEPAPPTWYYCANPPGYYPSVQQCPGGWQPVAPPP